LRDEEEAFCATVSALSLIVPRGHAVTQSDCEEAKNKKGGQMA
jgi:hypothetical protein